MILQYSDYHENSDRVDGHSSSNSDCLSVLIPIFVISLLILIWLKYDFETALTSLCILVLIIAAPMIFFLVYEIYSGHKKAKARKTELEEINLNLKTKAAKDEYKKSILLDFYRIEQGILGELGAANQRANIFLGLGILLSIIGVGFLINSFISFDYSNLTFLKVIQNILPKVGITALIQLLALYFLRANSNTTQSKKGMINELIKIRKTTASIKIAFMSNNSDQMKAQIVNILNSFNDDPDEE